MAEHFLYLTTKGRKSGEPREIEIWFVEHAGRHYMISEHRAESNWFKNIQSDPGVTYSIGSRDDRAAGLAPCRATGRAVDDPAEPDLARAVRALMDAKYGWSDGLIVELSRAG